ncbi:MAG: HDOD domain-containing protein, partial [Desulfofustis sp.]|nr:HDOD domain-containing protein [Desulfofustis sp.]
MGPPDSGTIEPTTAALLPPSDTARVFVDLASDKSATLTELTTTLDQDPHLAAALVRFASVSSSSSATPVLSVRRALMKIGLESALSLVPALSIMTRHQAGESEQDRAPAFWSFSLARAIAARTLALLYNNLDPNDFFVAALLAQIGRFGCEICPPASSVSFDTQGADQALQHEPDIIADDLDPQDLGARLLTSWGMPECQCALVATFVPASESLSSPPPPVLEIALLRFADAIAESLVLQQPTHAIADIAS